MKKRILIVSHAMEIGGAERALLGILENIDTEIYQVDLFLMRQEGELLNLIPETINLLSEIPEYTVLTRPITTVLKERHFLLAAARIYGKYKAKKFDKKKNFTESGVAIEYSHKYTKRFMPNIQPSVQYDMAISFLTTHYFVTEKVQAKQKIAWIHTDYSVVQVSVLAMLVLHLFDRLDFQGLYYLLLYFMRKPVVFYFAQISDFCVMGFAFCSGYGLYKQYTKYDEKKYFSDRLKGIRKLLVNYSTIHQVSGTIKFPSNFWSGFYEKNKAIM